METTTHRSAARTRLSVGAFVVSTVYVFLALGLIAWVVLPTVLLGLRPTVITSGSMAPLIAAGDIVLYEPTTPDDQLEPGVVITYDDPVFERLVTHRIVERVDDGYVTRGDATGEDDPRIVRTDEVAGRGRLLVPFVGLPLLWIRRGAWLLLLVWFGLTVLAIRRSSLPRDPEDGDDRGAGEPGPRSRPRPPVRSLGMTQLLTLGTAAALLLTIPSSNAAFGALAANTGNGFEIGTWATSTPTTYYAQSNGTWTTTAPTGAGTSLRLDLGTFAMLPVTTATTDVDLSGSTQLDVWVRRRGQPGPRTLHVALLWGTEVVRASYTATPGTQPELWTIPLPTGGRTIPAGTAVSLVYELDTTSSDRLDIWYGSPTTPTALTFPDPLS